MRGRKPRRSTTRKLLISAALLLAALANTVTAEAVTIGFSLTTGFESAGATLQTLAGGAPVATGSGLEFFDPITAPPGPPLGDGSVPAGIWSVVGWGCRSGNCAPNGITLGSATDPFTNANRSALRISGLSGLLTDADWTDITLIEHRNQVITGNVLKSLSIETILRFGSDPGALAINDSILLGFRETPNASCTVAPLPGAPINPLGSTCDDFFIVESLDLATIAIGGGLFIDFRLDAREGALVCTGQPAVDPAACGGYTGSAVLVYTGENDINLLAVQARLRLESTPVPGPPVLVVLTIGISGLALLSAGRRRRAA